MKTHQWPVRVYYEDTDAGGIVYHSNYLNFMERARTEWLRALGFEQDQLREELSIVFPVRQANMDFLAPARFNDQLLVTSRVDTLKKASLWFQQEITDIKNNKILCKGSIRIACVRLPDFKPTPLPQQLIMELNP